MKIYFRMFYGRYNDILQYSTSAVFVWHSPLFLCVTYHGFDLIRYDWLLYSWFHGGYVATAGEVYSSVIPIQTLGFSRLSVLSCCLCCVYELMILDLRMVDVISFLIRNTWLISVVFLNSLIISFFSYRIWYYFVNRVTPTCMYNIHVCTKIWAGIRTFKSKIARNILIW